MKPQDSLRYPSPPPARARSGPEPYLQLLKLAARLTEARQAALFLPHSKRPSLISLAGGGLPPAFGEAGRAVAPKGVPRLFHPQSDPGRPILAVPLQDQGRLLGVLLLGDRPQAPLTGEDLNLVTLLAKNPLVSAGLAGQEKDTGLESIKVLVRSLEARDHYTGQHSHRVTEMALHFACHLGLPREDLQSLRVATYLHDLGKVGVSDAVLLKPGPLSREERAAIQAHPVIGTRIVESLKLTRREMEIILHHHERWDGQGYPLGLAGQKIPFFCRLVALADVYDALTSDRPYRRRFTIAEALEEILAQAGAQFDPDLAQKFLQMLAAHAEEPRPGLSTGITATGG